MTKSSLFKVKVFGDVTLRSVIVTDISVLEKHVVEVALKLEMVMSALLHDVLEDRIFGMYRR
jgi:hypothetical protein